MNGIAQVRQMTGGQVKDLGVALVQAVPTDLTFESAEYTLKHKTELAAHIRLFFSKTEDLTNPVKQWEQFYLKAFGLTADLSGVKIPERTAEQAKELTRLIIVLQGFTQEQVYAVCKKSFPSWKYADDLDKSIPTNERDPKNGTYAIWVRDTVEADEIHRNKSANMIREEGLKTETNLERMLHELKYFMETGKHLDIQNITLCSGSRYSDGDVPGGDWSGGRFDVDYYSVGNRYDRLRPREVIS
jgi:hypothetical protein